MEPSSRLANLSEAQGTQAGERLFLVTKFAIPPVRSDMVARPRLTNQLQSGLQHSLTLVAAPAGFGKTTVLSTWLEHAPFSAAWLSLESSDDDLTRFWSYVFAALAHAHISGGESALALLQESDSQELPSIETILTIWINHLTSLPHEEAVLILDDYHVITASTIHRSIAFLVDHLPSNFHLVIATRADPPLPLARLRTRDQLTEIRAADLRFTSFETNDFLTRTLNLNLSEEDIAVLEARTEGWIAGLQLAGLSMQGREDIPAFLKAFTGSQHYIIDYLTEEVLAFQPESIQAFLLQTSILERLQGSLCDALISEQSGESNSQAILEQLEQANLFLIPLDEERLWYRYHQLFAEALRHRLQRKYPSLVPELHRRAGIWYEQQGLIYDAVHHALTSADFALAARLVEQAFNGLVRRGEIATLQRWTAMLPDELIRSSIELSVLQGWLLFIGGKHNEALLCLENIERTFGITPVSSETDKHLTLTSGKEAEIKGRIAAIRASIAVTQGDIPRTIALSRLALEFLPKENISRAYAAWYLGRAYWLSGDVRAASRALAEASSISWEVNHLYAVFLVTHDLAHVQKLQGQLHVANQTYLRAIQQAQERGADLPAAGPAYVGRGNIEYEWNHLDAATALLQEGIKRCERAGNGRVILQAHMTLAFIKQAQGDSDGANAIMQRVVERASRQHISEHRHSQVEASSAWLSLMQGDETAVLHWLQHCDLDQKITHLREREYLTLVRVLIMQHRLDEAKQWLANLLQLAELQGRTGSMIELFMLQAKALYASGEMNQAIELLSQALSLAEPEGYVRLFVDEGTPIAHLLRQISRRTSSGHSDSTYYREHLLTLFATTHEEDVPFLAPSVATPGTNPLYEPLSDRELDVLHLIIAGYSNREIAERLVIAVSTVKWYVNIIYGKLQVESRTKAIVRARELNIM